MPSIVDVVSLSGLRAKLGVIACHDGSIIRFSVVDDRYRGYIDGKKAEAQKSLNRFVVGRFDAGKSESEIFEAIGNEWGVEIERIRFGE